jgi:hypothetical protein
MILGFGILTSQLLQSKLENKLTSIFFGLYLMYLICASRYVMSPPIREAGHGKALQAALSSGILQLVGTDHCTFNSTQKAFGSDDFRKIPNGVNDISPLNT